MRGSLIDSNSTDISIILVSCLRPSRIKQNIFLLYNDNLLIRSWIAHNILENEVILK